MFDPNNKVVLLCVEGMNTEAHGKIEEAHALFMQAWDIAEDELEKFTAAHYVARNQANPEDNLHWNVEALHYALKLDGEEMKAHYPSLYLNVAKAYETLHNHIEAARHYTLAAEYSNALPLGKYAEMIKMGISEGLKRTNAVSTNNAVLNTLVNGWCERKELKPLAIILPAYAGNLGTENDRNKLLSALHYLSATKCLDNKEQAMVEEMIKESV
jgi:hypothetical protein